MTKNKPEGLAAGADRTMRWVLKGWQDWQLEVGGVNNEAVSAEIVH